MPWRTRGAIPPIWPSDPQLSDPALHLVVDLARRATTLDPMSVSDPLADTLSGVLSPDTAQAGACHEATSAEPNGPRPAESRWNTVPSARTRSTGSSPRPPYATHDERERELPVTTLRDADVGTCPKVRRGRTGGSWWSSPAPS